ncbi:hypothetical protein [Anaerotignum sp. MB30-C6]|uniref:hypothetical protein n=1 Tax=Anaerotignum sp. MB30-C6 TaxID=3070814 RepID=UPI0027DEA274|nr:hypothetical protein [Anaerotignum sp. MB30-C6]WMI82631.1 hypothetical protein RBQ60_07860 [Anaerotignum sp. MB30-C6]
MNFVIQIYMIICVALIIFDIAFLVLKNLRGKKFGGKDSKTKDFLMKQFRQYNAEKGFGKELKFFLTKSISKTKNLVVLQNVLEELDEHKSEIYLEIKPYILNLITEYKGKSEYERAFYAYVVSCLSFEDESPTEQFYKEFFSFLDSQSLYTFSNAMIGFYRFKDPYALNNAIKKVDEKGTFYHGKLFVDGLLEFNGDKQELNQLMKENFFVYAPSTQVSILNYFRQNGMDEGDFCFEVWQNKDINEEVIYAAMRYFAKFPREESRQKFITILKNDDSNWIEQLLAIQGLTNYNDFMVRAVIKRKSTHPNWYIRTNAVGYLHDNGLDKHEILEILRLFDHFTNDALLYHYREDEETTSYIVKTIQRLEREKNEDTSWKPAVLQYQREGGLSV